MAPLFGEVSSPSFTCDLPNMEISQLSLFPNRIRFKFNLTYEKAIGLSFSVSCIADQAQEITTQIFNDRRIVTLVESIIPMGLGRSRMVENMTDVNTQDFRTSRVDGNTSF